MTALLVLCNGLGQINGAVLAFCRWIGAACLGLMVVVILMQVFFRYALGSALAWPEEASRFLMLWLMGLMAATAFRRGGFVAIDMMVAKMPARLGMLTTSVLLLLTIITLAVSVQIGLSEVTGIGGQFETDSLWLPVMVTESGWLKMPKSWMMASMLVCVTLLLAVAVELFLRSLATLLGARDGLSVIPETITLGSE